MSILLCRVCNFSAIMKPKTSLIWSYFIEIDDAKARCQLCDKVYSRKGRTTSALKSHIKAIHAEEFAEFEKLNEVAKLSSETKKEKVYSIPAENAKKQLNYNKVCKLMLIGIHHITNLNKLIV